MNRNKVRKATLQYFNGDEMATDAWINKYCLKDGDNYLELTPEDMHDRMINEFKRAHSERKDDKIKSEKLKILSDYGKKFYSNGVFNDKLNTAIRNFKYIVPQGSIMSQLGNNIQVGSLSNCFVIGQPEDSYGGIFQKDQQLAQLMKRRGGVGLDISTLRPNKTKVNNTAGNSTGAASFMERFSNTTREVAQDGRRGALMLTIDCRHPDVLDFINSKQDRTKVTGANISVMLRDDFMEAVKADRDYMLRFPCDAQMESPFASEMEYNKVYESKLGRNKGKGIVKKVRAKEIYDAIVENAHDNAEPGQMFINTHWDYSPDGVYEQFKGITTNPCGEIFMGEYDACRLLALNLPSFVRNKKVEWNEVYSYAYTQQVLADYIIDLELEKIETIIDKIQNDPEDNDVKRIEFELWGNIYRVTKASRRTGSGFTGLADMLALLNIKYDSQEAKYVIEELMQTKMRAELDSTIDRAKLHGPFQGWDRDLEWKSNGHGGVGQNEFYSVIADEFEEQFNEMLKYGRRNVSWSTVAPTGTVSLLTQSTSGLEPLFMPYYMRRRKINPTDIGARVDFVDDSGDSWMEYPIIHNKLVLWYMNLLNNKAGEEDEQEDKYSFKEVQKLLEIAGEEQLARIFKKSPWYGSTANDINWSARIDIQSIIQEYTTHSISSTLNLPSNVTIEEVSKIYMEAYQKNLKGITIYRDGSRTGVLVSNETKPDSFDYKDAIKRPKSLPCTIHHLTAKGKDWTVLIGLFDNKPYEVFAFPQNGLAKKYEDGELVKIKQGEYNLNFTDGESYDGISAKMNDEEEAITRLISTALRHGADVKHVTSQLNKSNGTIVSFSKAIARALKRYTPEEEQIKLAMKDCPKDGQDCNIVFEEGCSKCLTHGTSKCG